MYQRTLNSFSGCDLQVSFASRVIGELQQISYSIEREKVAIYHLGSPNPASFARGKRGIAGTMIFLQFYRDALLEELKAVWEQIAPPVMFTAAGNLDLWNKDQFGAAINMTAWDAAGTAAQMKEGVVSATNPNYRVNVPAGFEMISKDNIIYVDQLPPFDVTLTWANEYGAAAFQKIYDCEILNSGMGASIDTVVIERPMTFVARKISPVQQGVYKKTDGGLFVPLPVVQEKIR